MRRRDGLLAVLATSAAMCSPTALAQKPASPVGEIKPLGQDRYQIGRVIVDTRARAFTVPGRVHLLDKPLEYLATSPGGFKEYETLLELDVTGSEFNLACILVGLERDPRQREGRPTFDAPLPGQRVSISVAWLDGGKRRQVSAAEALLNPGAETKPESVEWVYTGSPASDGQERFAADFTGTLIAFKPDANAIIESAKGIGIGAYGSVRGNSTLPPGRIGHRADRHRLGRIEVIITRWALLVVAALLLPAALGITASEGSPSALRLTVTAVVGLLAPLFWPGLAATPGRSVLRVAIWSVATVGAAAIALVLTGSRAQAWLSLFTACAMLLPIVLMAHALTATLEATLRAHAFDPRSAREAAGALASLGLALLAALPLWLGPLMELLSVQHGWTLDAFAAASPLVHLAVASGNDLLRNQWFYEHSNLSALQLAYPKLGTLTWAYGFLCLGLALTALAVHTSHRPPGTPLRHLPIKEKPGS